MRRGSDEGSRSDLADASLIATIAQGLATWQQSTGHDPPLKPLREAFWFYWQQPRLPRPLFRGKYPVAAPWSAAARAAYEDGTTSGRLMIEHAVPLKVTLRKVIETAQAGPEAIKVLLADEVLPVVITKEEHHLLAAAGLANQMPLGWRPGNDPWVRYREAGLGPGSFKPLGEA